jgi:hypothetical protein
MLHLPLAGKKSTKKSCCNNGQSIEPTKAAPSFPGIWSISILAALATFWLYFNSKHHLELNVLNKEELNHRPIEPLHNLTSLVNWDKYSLFIKGQRVFIWSGEIHPWRIPVKSQWLDVLQKIKASGMNAISVYAHWS